MAARSIASLTLSFGLVTIPVRLYSATESAASIRFNLLAKDGSRVKQQYISEKDQTVIARSEMVKGYEVEKDRFVIFSAEELKKLEEGAATSLKSWHSCLKSRSTRSSMTRPTSLRPTNAAENRMHSWQKLCAPAENLRWQSGPGRPSNMLCRCARPKAVLCSSSCFTPTRYAR